MQDKPARARIKTGVCTVFYGAGRKRYFTASGDAKSIASKTYLDKFGCECAVTMAETGDFCDTHRIIRQDHTSYYQGSGKRFRRYVRMLRHLLRKSAKTIQEGQ